MRAQQARPGVGSLGLRFVPELLIRLTEALLRLPPVGLLCGGAAQRGHRITSLAL
jgi:hypothetical protein